MQSCLKHQAFNCLIKNVLHVEHGQYEWVITVSDAYITSIMYVQKHIEDGSHVLVMIFSSVNLQGKPGTFELKYKQHSQNHDKRLPINHHWNEFNSHVMLT